MLHDLLSFPLADSGGASNTLGITIVSGIVTILVSLIGVFGTRVRKESKQKNKVELPTDEDRFEAEIERLTRICYEWDIDPRNGDKMRHKGGRHGQASEEYRTGSHSSDA